ncbi:hypothetical protein [Methanoregula sp.]|uniref:hypothetical protein n=1 Tax=Methanoregula sp. TaxID=2052170 RepID=UPI002372CA22|nr:hypothetical protein [Methanoregula sp.]MDD1687779.1 hypothetical protein [Methanoregula sp.]
MSPEKTGMVSPTATIDIAEIVSRIQNLESAENDAIIVCCGLGGMMTDIVPHVIAGLRSSIVEPIFGLVTLPCLAEGAKRSCKAADDIDILSPLLDGMIVFDNETWYKKTRTAHANDPKKEKGIAQMLGFGKAEPEISPELATYLHINEAIVRRISLILKAGEFRADGGIDLAEVVLDSGEVLNTMKDGGFITIGYAVERLPNNPLAFLSQLKPAGLVDEESKKKASRIVELAKQAIYHEISTPCDMTSAHKALVLIAGPSHELSMQGFMTVRKWIDRSIRGLEMRSGDYPVMNTKNVAIIIMLSGLENIPRINELQEIREQARLGPVRGTEAEEETFTPRISQDTGSLRDEMIVLPTTMQKVTEKSHHPREEFSHTTPPIVPASEQRPVPPVNRPDPQLRGPVPPVPRPVPQPRPPEVAPPGRMNAAEGRAPQYPVRPVIQPQQRTTPPQYATQRQRAPSQQPILPDTPPARPRPPAVTPPPKNITGGHAAELTRQRIEQELQRQRMMALSGTRATPQAARVPPAPQQTPPEIIRPKRQVISTTDSPHPLTARPVLTPSAPQQDLAQTGEKKTVIIRKRQPVPEASEAVEPSPTPDTVSRLPEPVEEMRTPDLHSPDNYSLSEVEEKPIVVKDPSFRAKDGIFSGKNVFGTSIPKVRDTSLFSTNLKQKKNLDPITPKDTRDEPSDQKEEATPEQTRDKKIRKKDDLSWI